MLCSLKRPISHYLFIAPVIKLHGNPKPSNEPGNFPKDFDYRRNYCQNPNKPTQTGQKEKGTKRPKSSLSYRTLHTIFSKVFLLSNIVHPIVW